MPTYEYACVDCGHRFEIVQRIDDGPLTMCDVCGGPLRKVFHPTGIVFKGSGFYATDSRQAKTKASGKGTDNGQATAPSEEKKPSPAGEVTKESA